MIANSDQGWFADILVAQDTVDMTRHLLPHCIPKGWTVNDELRYRDGHSIDKVTCPGGVPLDEGAARHVPQPPRGFRSLYVSVVQLRVGDPDG